MSAPVRILTAVPICDGHDSAINTINLEFIRHGIEVVYLGFHRYVGDIVRAAIQEDVAAIGISSYNGGHIEFFAEVVRQLRKKGADDIAVFGGGGGTITHEDARIMKRKGVDEIFFAGTSLEQMAAFVHEQYGKRRRKRVAGSGDLALARKLREIEDAYASERKIRNQKSEIRNSRRARVIGFTGPGGAGKTTLIDELVLRFLQQNGRDGPPGHPAREAARGESARQMPVRPGPVAPYRARIAILSHDPSVVGAGALLGDRATMINSQDDRVFMRSMATRGQAGGLSPATENCLKLLAHSGFDYVFIETVGTGQEAMPFRDGLVDQTVLVMNPDYGARLQLQKIVMLDVADIVVVNKTDLDRAKAALLEIEQRLGQNKRNQQLVATVAKRHRDAGVNKLYDMITRDSSSVATVYDRRRTVAAPAGNAANANARGSGRHRRSQSAATGKPKT